MQRRRILWGEGDANTKETLERLQILRALDLERILKLMQIGAHGVHLRGFSSFGWSSWSGKRREYCPALQSSRSGTREYFLPWLVQSIQNKRIFLALASLVGPVQENISCLGLSSWSGTREYFLPWLVQSVQYKRIFLALASLVSPVQENIFPTGRN